MTWLRVNNTLNLQFCLFVHVVDMVNLNKCRDCWDHILNSRMLTTDRLQIFKEGFSDYFQQTTLHGWQYIDSDRFFSKIFWIIVSIDFFLIDTPKRINIWSRHSKVQEPIDMAIFISCQFPLWKSTALGQEWSIISMAFLYVFQNTWNILTIVHPTGCNWFNDFICVNICFKH